MPLLLIFHIFADIKAKNMKTKNKHPERFSFTEIKSMLKNVKEQKNILQLVGKDIGMLRAGHKMFNTMLQTGTPYIIEDCRVGFIKNGEARIMINLIEHTVKKNTLVFIGTGSIIQINRFSPDFELCGIMISTERLNIALNGNIPAEYNGNAYDFILTPAQNDIEIADRLFRSVWDLISQEHRPEETLDGLIHALIHYYRHLKEKSNGTVSSEKPHSRIMFDRFIRLVNTYNRQEHSLSFYADKMCVTPRYLGVVVKETSGVTAKEWIDRAIATNAKVMLKYGNRPVIRIADDLSFPNPSFFCKFFKRMTGTTPQEYRLKKVSDINMETEKIQ